MIILGLNLAHDAGVCVVDSGRVVGLFQRERFTRVKRQAFMRAEFLRSCLKHVGLNWTDVDAVAVTSSQSWPLILLDPDEFSLRHDAAAAAAFPLRGVDMETYGRAVKALDHRQSIASNRHATYLDADHTYGEYFGVDIEQAGKGSRAIPSMDWPLSTGWWRDAATPEQVHGWCRELENSGAAHLGYSPLIATLDGVSRPGLMVPHHLSHAASAYYPSDHRSAAIYTLDNGDGFDLAMGYKGGIYALGAGNRIAPIGPTYDYQGHFYQRVGEKLKLGHGGAAGKLMGLAPYGKPRFMTEEMIGNGHRVFGTDFAHGKKRDRNHVLDPLEVAFERRRKALYRRVPHLSEHHVPDAFGADDLKRPGIDLAATAQKMFEDNALRSIRVLHDGLVEAGLAAQALVMAGGGALNCPANSRIWGEGLFEDIFVPPYCDDSGLALGAALALAHDVLNEPRQSMSADAGAGAYLGLAYDTAAVDAALETRHDGIREVAVEDAARAAASDVAAGRIVAWFEGRSEVGPRALGHRSILADPRDATKWREVNRVKKREYWRPFAPAVLAEKAGDWFSGTPTPSPFMLFNAQVRSKDLPAITHVDGSARIQTVDASCGGFRRVLEAFEAETGVPVVMNTSFNGPGEPIVETPDHALAFLETSEIDAVYVEGRKFVRRQSD